MFILTVFLFIATIGCAGAVAAAPRNQRPGWAAGTAVALALTLVFFLFSGLRSVPVHSVGVKTAGGKIEGSLRPGWHWFNAPWSKVNILDETVQTQTWHANSWNPNDQNPTCLTVRIGGQQLACINITIKWQLEDAAAPSLFNNYDNRGTDVMSSITNNLVTVDLNSVANNVFGDYNPIEDTALTTTVVKGHVVTSHSQFSSFGPAILRAMRSDLAGKISVLSINLGNPFYAGATEARLAGIANQFADTAIAQELLATNQALAAANKALQIGLNPLVVYANCVTGTLDALKNGHTPNVGWSCSSPAAIAALAAGH